MCNKYAHFYALSQPFKANTVTTAFMDTIQKLHGMAKIIHITHFISKYGMGLNIANEVDG